MADVPKNAHARAVVTADRIQVAGTATAVGKPRAHSGHGKPRVELVQEGDLIRAVDVTCSCGERIRLLLEYEGM